AKSFVNPIRRESEFIATPLAKPQDLNPPPLGTNPRETETPRDTTPDPPQGNGPGVLTPLPPLKQPGAETKPDQPPDDTPKAAKGTMPAKADPKGAVPNRPSLKDPAIEKGLTSLARFIGFPAATMPKKIAMGNLYFLWSVERVAVLYNLKTVGERDWYTWGAQ